MAPIEIIEQLGFKKDESTCENYIRFKNKSDDQVIFDRFIAFIKGNYPISGRIGMAWWTKKVKEGV